MIQPYKEIVMFMWRILTADRTKRTQGCKQTLSSSVPFGGWRVARTTRRARKWVNLNYFKEG